MAALRAPWYGAAYLAGHLLLRKHTPLIRGLVLTNRCNLHCRHCDVAARDAMDLGFDEVTAAVDAFYGDGGRCLYLEGGEPFLWRDGFRGVDDIASSYVRTLRLWRTRFLESVDAVRAQGFDDRFIRMWEYYLALCEAGFATGLTQDLQIVMEKGRGLEA